MSRYLSSQLFVNPARRGEACTRGSDGTLLCFRDIAGVIFLFTTVFASPVLFSSGETGKLACTPRVPQRLESQIEEPAGYFQKQIFQRL